MFRSGGTFDIVLDNSTGIYTPGSLITGQVILGLPKPKTFRALKLKFEGRCKVQWTGKSTGSGTNTQTEGYTGKEQYFRTELCLFGKKSGSTELSAGLHTFPFNFQLPRSIPNSFEHNIGFVRYSVKAIIERSWKANHEIEVIFRVETPLDLDSSYSLQGIDDEIRERYCCMLISCIHQKNIVFRFRLPKVGYMCGDYIEATVDIDYQTASIEVIGLRLALEQVFLFHSRKSHKRKNETIIIETARKEGPFPEDTKEVIGLKVPIVPLSRLQYCNLIDIHYKIIFYADISGCHHSVKRKYDILIGSGPSATSSQQQVTDSIPIVPSAPSYDSTSLSVPPPSYPSTQLNLKQPVSNIGFIYPHPSVPINPTPKPPPSTNESVIIKNTNA